MIIYHAYNVENGKSYIGLTTGSIEKRRMEHESLARRGSETYFHRAIRKYGDRSFEWSEMFRCNDIEKLKSLEILSISLFERDQLYNLTDGGDGTFGRVLSAETRRKISENHADFSGENHPRYGHKTSSETKAKISKSLTGRIYPKRWCSKEYTFVSKEGDVFTGTIRHFCEEKGLSPSSVRGVTSGRRKTHKGWSVRVCELVDV